MKEQQKPSAVTSPNEKQLFQNMMDKLSPPRRRASTSPRESRRQKKSQRPLLDTTATTCSTNVSSSQLDQDVAGKMDEWTPLPTTTTFSSSAPAPASRKELFAYEADTEEAVCSVDNPFVAEDPSPFNDPSLATNETVAPLPEILSPSRHAMLTKPTVTRRLVRSSNVSKHPSRGSPFRQVIAEGKWGKIEMLRGKRGRSWSGPVFGMLHSIDIEKSSSSHKKCCP